MSSSRSNSIPRANSINVGNDPDIAFSGWLIKAPPLKHAKEASTKRWRKRFFVLRRSMFRLTYYASNEDVNSMKGEIDLKFCQRVQLSVDGGRKKHVFSLRFPTREYFFQAMNEGDMIKWGHYLTELFDSRSKSIQSASGTNKATSPQSSTTVNQRMTTVPTSAHTSKGPTMLGNKSDNRAEQSSIKESPGASSRQNEAQLGRQMRDRSQSIAPPPNRGPQCPPPPAPPAGASDKAPPATTITESASTTAPPPRPQQTKPANAPSPAAEENDSAPPFAPRAPPTATDAGDDGAAPAGTGGGPPPPRRTSSISTRALPTGASSLATNSENAPTVTPENSQKRRADVRASAPAAPGGTRSASPGHNTPAVGSTEGGAHGTVGHRDSVVARHRATAVAAAKQTDTGATDEGASTAATSPRSSSATLQRVLTIMMDDDDNDDEDEDDENEDSDGDCFNDYDNADQYFSPKERLQLELTDWEQVVDPTSGETYYHNVVTGVTSWEKPGSDPTVDTAAAADAWDEVVDDAGQRYFYNAATGQSSWTDPRVEHEELPGTVLYDYTASKVDEASVTAGDAVLVVTSDDGSGWIKIKTIEPPGVEGFVPLSYVEFQDDLEC